MLFHEIDKAIEQVTHFIGARAGFRVALEAESRPVSTSDALQAAVEQGDMCCAQVARQGGWINGKTVILAGDENTLVVVMCGFAGPTLSLLKKTFPGAHRCCGYNGIGAFQIIDTSFVLLPDFMHQQHVVAGRNAVNAFEAIYRLKRLLGISEVGAVAHGMDAAGDGGAGDALEGDEVEGLEEIEERVGGRRCGGCG